MPAQVIKPNSETQNIKYKVSVFLAGSIEMGSAEDWQTKIQDALADMDVTFFNPRRDDWDSTWEAKMNNPQFVAQVDWEFSHLEKADLIFLYLQPGTKSPISLYEMGRFYQTPQIICCPEGFWREGNVEFYTDRDGQWWEPDFNLAVQKLRESIENMYSQLHLQYTHL